MDSYWQAEWSATAFGLFITALVTLVVEWTHGRVPGEAWRVREPIRSVAIFLVYASALYPVAGLVSMAVGAQRPVGVFVLMCALAAAAHASALFAHAHARKGTALAMVPAAFDIIPDGIDDPNLAATVVARSERTGRVRIVIPDVDNVSDGRGTLGRAIQKAAKGGVNVKLVASPAGEPWVIIDAGDVAFLGAGANPAHWPSWPVLRVDRDKNPHGGEVLEWVRSQVDVMITRSATERAEVSLSTSPASYREAIVTAEADAARIDRIPKRISVMFRDPATVANIAVRRFGPGSSNIEHYVSEYNERRRAFFAALQRGATCREVYSTDEILEYATSRQHGPNVTLTPEEMVTTLFRWRDAVQHQPNYHVALSRERVPFKYEVIDDSLVVMHEVIGSADRHRLNAIFVRSRAIAASVREDFETVWDRCDRDLRTRERVVEWITDILVPAASRPDEPEPLAQVQ